jgi:hypothetical protein
MPRASSAPTTCRPRNPLGALDEGAPGAAADVAVQRYLDARRAAHAGEPRRDDTRVVGDQQIARPQQRGQVADGAVGEIGPDHEQPRRVARLNGMVRDQVSRQLEIESVDAHGASAVAADAREGKTRGSNRPLTLPCFAWVPPSPARGEGMLERARCAPSPLWEGRGEGLFTPFAAATAAPG